MNKFILKLVLMAALIFGVQAYAEEEYSAYNYRTNHTFINQDYERLGVLITLFDFFTKYARLMDGYEYYGEDYLNNTKCPSLVNNANAKYISRKYRNLGYVYTECSNLVTENYKKNLRKEILEYDNYINTTPPEELNEIDGGLGDLIWEAQDYLNEFELDPMVDGDKALVYIKYYGKGIRFAKMVKINRAWYIDQFLSPEELAN